MVTSHESMPADQDLLEKIRQLDSRQRVEVIDFIDFLITRQSSERLPIETPIEKGASEISLREVRKRLSTIRGTMANTVNEMRDDRV